MEKIKLNDLKKLARIIHHLKMHKINTQDVAFGDGRDLGMVEKELGKKGIEIK